MSLTDTLLLTLASTTLCIALPKLLSILLTNTDKQIKPTLQETLSQVPSSEVHTFLTEG